MGKNKVLAIIQARMGSSRLPGKTLEIIEGKPLLEHIIDRLKYSKTIDEIMIATTSNKEDEAIISLAGQKNALSYAGSSEDVLDRFYQAAKVGGGEVLVRITADDPFKDPIVIDEIVKYFISRPNLAYVSNTIKPTYPLGIDVEVFSFTALEKTWKEASALSDHEHVTSYIWRNPDLFNIANIENDRDLTHLRWTIDTREDLEMTREVYKKLYKEGKVFLMNDILEILQKYPYISKINRCIQQKHINK